MKRLCLALAVLGLGVGLQGAEIPADVAEWIATVGNNDPNTGRADKVVDLGARKAAFKAIVERCEADKGQCRGMFRPGAGVVEIEVGPLLPWALIGLANEEEDLTAKELVYRRLARFPDGPTYEAPVYGEGSFRGHAAAAGRRGLAEVALARARQGGDKAEALRLAQDAFRRDKDKVYTGWESRWTYAPQLAAGVHEAMRLNGWPLEKRVPALLKTATQCQDNASKVQIFEGVARGLSVAGKTDLAALALERWAANCQGLIVWSYGDEMDLPSLRALIALRQLYQGIPGAAWLADSADVRIGPEVQRLLAAFGAYKRGGNWHELRGGHEAILREASRLDAVLNGQDFQFGD